MLSLNVSGDGASVKAEVLLHHHLDDHCGKQIALINKRCCCCCAAGYIVGHNIFSNDIEGKNKTTKQNELKLLLPSPVLNRKVRNPKQGCPPSIIIMVYKTY